MTRRRQHDHGSVVVSGGVVAVHAPLGGYGCTRHTSAARPPSYVSARYFPPMVDFSNEEEWTQDRIDDEFPLGDGDAETEAFIECPYCGETNEITLDPGSGSDQEYVEDCQVCCRPWLMHVRYARDGSAEIKVIRSDS